MDENNNETTAPQETANAVTPVEKAVQFVNAEVLSPPTAAPMGGMAKVMMDQSAGMMVQDLQSFLKSFEQLGLIALSRLANNLLTYGTWSENEPPPTGRSVKDDNPPANGNEMIRDLFKIVSEYADAKTKISSAAMFSTVLHPDPAGTQPSDSFSNAPVQSEDPEKKKRVEATEENRTEKIPVPEQAAEKVTPEPDKVPEPKPEQKEVAMPAEVHTSRTVKRSIFLKLMNQLKKN